MKINFVNHASFIIENNNTQLICDPWLEGTAFDNGWKLLSPTLLEYERFNNITHIWFSHEHPDHFSPSNLSKIRLEYRRTISILYQKAIDKKVTEFCRTLEFKEVIELEPNTYFDIDSELKLLCNPYTDGDSYALFKTDKTTILNLNDCIVNSRKRAKALARVTGEVDILFTQFGYANKVGNIGETHKRIAASNEKLERIRYQNEFLKPKVIVPFASFIYFCHEENYYMNNGVNRIDKVYNFIENELQTECIVLYPNDSWDLRVPYNSTNNAIEQYKLDYKKMGSEPHIKSEKVEISTLIMESGVFISDLKNSNPKSKGKIEQLKANVYLTDFNESFVLSGKTGLKKTNVDYKDCDIALSSEAMHFVFKHKWGGDTLNVNARFQIPEFGHYDNFYIFARIASLNNRGETKEFPSRRSRIINRLKHLLTEAIGDPD